MGVKFDITTDKGLAAFNGFMGSRSYVEGYNFSSADSEVFGQFGGATPDATKLPHAYRWYIHIAALSGVRGIFLGAPAASAPTASAPTASAPTASAPATTAPAAAADSTPAPAKPAAPPAEEAKKSAGDEDDDDFDVFGDDDDDEEDAPKKEISPERAEMLAKLKKEAEERTAAKEAKQRTLVAIEIKPWDVEQDLMALWKKITQEITQDGLKWGENCNLADVAFGIKKIQTTFVMGVNNSSDDVVEAILAMEDDVQSCEVTSMNVL